VAGSDFPPRAGVEGVVVVAVLTVGGGSAAGVVACGVVACGVVAWGVVAGGAVLVGGALVVGVLAGGALVVCWVVVGRLWDVLVLALVLEPNGSEYWLPPADPPPPAASAAAGATSSIAPSISSIVVRRCSLRISLSMSSARRDADTTRHGAARPGGGGLAGAG
jgi:hypothetical protein